MREISSTRQETLQTERSLASAPAGAFVDHEIHDPRYNSQGGCDPSREEQLHGFNWWRIDMISVSTSSHGIVHAHVHDTLPSTFGPAIGARELQNVGAWQDQR